MRLERLGRDPVEMAAPGRWLGAVLCRDLIGADGRPLLHKGHRLERADALILEAARPEALHLLWLEPGDIDEDTAAIRLAVAAAGAGVVRGRPVESQVRLSAQHRGVLHVDAEALAAVNGVEGVTIFALPDGMPVEAGRTLAGVKITPLAIDEATLAAAEAAAAGRLLTVRPLRRLAVAVVVRERLSAGARERFERSLRAKLSWFGGSLTGVAYLTGDGDGGPHGDGDNHRDGNRDRDGSPDRDGDGNRDGDGDADQTRAALAAATAEADLVLAVGVASTDPLEMTWRSLLAAGARVIRRGLPVHPGSSYWIVDLDGRPVIGVASCGMFSRRTALDLLLVRLFAGEPLDPPFLAGLGHGGLLASEMAWRFPAYEPVSVAEE